MESVYEDMAYEQDKTIKKLQLKIKQLEEELKKLKHELWLRG